MPRLSDFAFEHLPEHLQEVSQPFHDLAAKLEASTPINTEQHNVSMQKLLEAKDAAVRAVLPR